MAADKPFKIPKSLGAAADLLYNIRQERLDLQRKVDELRKQQTELENHFIENLPKSEASGVGGKIGKVAITKKEVPQVKDWDAFYKYVKRTGEFDLMQRRISNSAVEERLDAGKKVPGIELFTAIGVSITKV